MFDFAIYKYQFISSWLRHAGGFNRMKICDAQKEPKLSIIIPCYNYSAFVGKAISSVIGQNNRESEIIVVDDGSTDGSWDIINNFDVRAYRLPNGGALQACIFGLDHTTAPFVLFLDADDMLAPNSLNKILALVDEKVAKLQYSLGLIDSEGRFIGSAAPALDDYRERSEIIHRVLRTGFYKTPPTSGNVFRRDVCNILREIDYEKYVDGVILYAAPFMGDIVSTSDELGFYRVHNHNVSSVGKALDAEVIRRDLRRFSFRMRHLQNFINAKTNYEPTYEIENNFVVQERSIYLTLSVGKKPSLSDVKNVIWKLLKQDEHSIKSKLALSTLFVSTLLLSNRNSVKIANYRNKVTHRSV
ncbi:glycosyltransferase family 2 protein, partial [Methylobacterium sp. WL119]|uniref:glycosyltransferase family 2 protein n=3 Tax=unclassified Methylobacterium TaxID=2615210 RepID=UPI0011CC745C